MPTITVQAPNVSRAVSRRVEGGEIALCPHCEEQIKFAPRETRFKVIANVYSNGRWARVEHFHYDCYIAAGEPHGTIDGTEERLQNPSFGKPRAPQ